jgi:bacteriocin-like protein
MSTKKTDQSSRLDSKPDDLIQEIETELTEHELSRVTGGKLDGIKGESQDDKHKDE